MELEWCPPPVLQHLIRHNTRALPPLTERGRHTYSTHTDTRIMSILVTYPRPGDVLEQGVEYALVADCSGSSGNGASGASSLLPSSSSSSRTFDEVHISIADARSWSRWWRPIAEVGLGKLNAADP